MEDKQLVVAEKKSLGERIGQSIGGAIRIGAISAAVGGIVGLFTGGADAGEVTQELLQEGVEGLQEGDVVQGPLTPEQAETVEATTSFSGRLANAGSTALDVAPITAAAGAGMGWANKIRLEQAEIQKTGHEIS